MNWIKQLILLVVLILLQVLVFQNLHWMGLCHPYVYVLFLLTMPRLPRWAELLVAAALGCMMDMFFISPGVHMAACVALIFMRGLFIDRMGKDAKRLTGAITSTSLGRVVFIKWVVSLVLIHHCLTFLLEAWSVHLLGWSMLATLLSSAFTIVFILGYDALNHD